MARKSALQAENGEFKSPYRHQLRWLMISIPDSQRGVSLVVARNMNWLSLRNASALKRARPGRNS